MRGKILFLAGSARRDSFNKRLAHEAHEMARARGADASFLDPADYPLPLYDGDLEAESGLPDNARRLKDMVAEHRGLFIVSPEYNGSLPPLLKNLVDWISRPETGDEVPLRAFRDTVAALAATSPGHFGGLRGLVPLRMLLGNIGVDVLGRQVTIPYYNEAFASDGRLHDATARDQLGALVDALAQRVEERGGEQRERSA